MHFHTDVRQVGRDMNVIYWFPLNCVKDVFDWFFFFFYISSHQMRRTIVKRCSYVGVNIPVKSGWQYFDLLFRWQIVVNLK